MENKRKGEGCKLQLISNVHSYSSYVELRTNN